MRNSTAGAVALVLLSLTGCDDKPADGGPQKAAPPPVSRVTTAYPEPMDARGEVDGLSWKHVVDAARITGMARCGKHVYTTTESGRVVVWEPEMTRAREIVPDIHGATTVHAVSDGVLFGLTSGRLLFATCDLENRVESRQVTKGRIDFAALDPRSKTRAFVISVDQEPGTARAALMEFPRGRNVHPPFEAKLAEGSETLGFLDYKAELWFSVVRPASSELWYLERFDPRAPSIDDLPDRARIEGLAQVQREVWAYGSHGPDSRGFIARVDTGRASMKWDGREAWFGTRPGGDVPTDVPILAVLHALKSIWVVTAADVYVADLQLRRWKKIPGGMPAGVKKITGHAVAGDRIFFTTPAGMLEVTTSSLTLRNIPPAEPRQQSSDPPVSLLWRGARLDVDGGSLRVTDGPALDAKVKNPLWIATDGLDRLWVLGEEDIYLFDAPDSTPRRWDAPFRTPVNAVGLAVSSKDAIGLLLEDGSAVHYRQATE